MVHTDLQVTPKEQEEKKTEMQIQTSEVAENKQKKTNKLSSLTLPKEGEGSVLSFYNILSKMDIFQQKRRPTKKQETVIHREKSRQ